MPSPRDLRYLAGVGALAVALPWASHAHIAAKTQRIADDLTHLTRTPASLGSIEATLSGAVVIDGLRLPGLLSLATVSAGVSFESLLDGRLRPDVVRVTSPVLYLDVDEDGSSALGRVVARLAQRRSRTASVPDVVDEDRRHLAVVVDRGTVRARLGESVELVAEDVAIRPHRGLWRVTSGRLEAVGRSPLRVHAEFPRTAADFDASSGRILRALAPAGVAIAGPTRFTDVVASIGVDGGARLSARNGAGIFELHAHLGAVELRLEDLAVAVLAPLVPSFLGVERAVVSGRLDIARDLEVRAHLDVQGMDLRHPVIASEPVPIDGVIDATVGHEGDAAWVVRNATLTSGSARLELDGRVALGSQPHVAARITLARLSCQDLLRSTPEPLRRQLAGLSVSGDIAARIELTYAADDAQLSSNLDHSCRVEADAALADPHLLLAPFEHRAHGTQFRVGDGPGYAPLHSLPGHVPAAFVAAEDRRFWRHNGFDERQIESSLGANIEAGKVLRGGSTITQQLVKNVYLSWDRTVARKLQEAVITWRVEAVLNKKQILDRYLNLIELGPETFGIEAAALYWFGRSASQLSPRQSAFLAALTRAPQTESRRIRAAGAIPADLNVRTDVILRAMERAGALRESTLRAALSEALDLAPLKAALRNQ